MGDGDKTSIGSFCWHDLMTNDVAAARTFYSALFGWEIEPEKEEPGDHDYLHISNAGCHIGGLMRCPEGQSIPPHWNGYVHMESVDDTVARATAAGGKLLVPGTDIPDSGRFAVFQDPDGAAVSAWQAAEDKASSDPRKDGVPGSFCWNELNAKNLDAEKSFYGEVFGWTARSMDMGPMGEYVIFATGDEDRCGMMTIPPDAPHPPHWMYYVAVESVDDAWRRAGELGAMQFVPPTDIPGAGRFAIVADPTGAPFGIYQGQG